MRGLGGGASVARRAAWGLALLAVTALGACDSAGRGADPGDASDATDATDTPSDVTPSDVDVDEDSGSGDAVDAAVADADADTDTVETDGEGPDADVAADSDDVSDGDAADAEADAPPEPVLGETCAEAIAIAADALPFTYEATTEPALDDVALAGGCGTGGTIGDGARDVVFAFMPDVSAWYLVGLSPKTQVGDAPRAVYVTTDCADATLGCVAASQDLTAGGVFSAYMQAGLTHYLVVDGLLPSDAGAFIFVLEEGYCVPSCAGDECGKDGCGGSCGPGCDPEGELVCAPDGVCRLPGELPNDACATAGSFGGEAELPASVQTDTWYGIDRYALPSGACGPGSPAFGGGWPDHVHRVEAPVTGLYTFTLLTEQDAVLAMLDGCPADTAATDVQCLAYVDDALGVEVLQTTLQAGDAVTLLIDGIGTPGPTTTPGDAYTLHIAAPCVPDCDGKDCGGDGCGGTCGSCAVEAWCSPGGQCGAPPAGDHCSEPIVVPTGTWPYVHEGDSSTFEADHHYDAFDCGGMPTGWGAASRDVVFELQAPADDVYLVTLDASFDATLYVTTSCPDVTSGCFDASEVSFGSEALTLELDEGQQVLVVVDGYGNLADVSGPFTLTITPACIPQCDGKGCGPDGCGGECGECQGAEICGDDGLCFELEGNSCVLPFELPSSPADLPVTVTGDTSDATHALAVPYDACPDETAVRGAVSPEEVYAFTPELAGVYTFDLDSDFASVLYVTDDCSDFQASCFTKIVDGLLTLFDVKWTCKPPFQGEHCAAFGTDFKVSTADFSVPVWLDAGVTVYVVVDGDSDYVEEGGAYTLTVSAPCQPQCEGKVCGDDGCGLTCGECDLGLVCDPDQQCVEQLGNACFTPFVVDDQALPYAYEGSTDDATNTYGIYKDTCGGVKHDRGGAGSRDEVFELTAPLDGLYQVDLTADYSAVVYVLDQCESFLSSCYYEETYGPNTWVATSGCAFGSSCLAAGFGLVQTTTFEGVAGATYYIVVDGLGGLVNHSGDYAITIDKACDPECDGKQCGDDGCGGSCGDCPAGWICTEDQQCEGSADGQGDSCLDPWNVGELPFLGTGDTTDDVDLTQGGDCPLGGPLGVGRDEVWGFTPTVTGLHLFTVTPEDGFDVVMHLSTGCDGGLVTGCAGTTGLDPLSADLTAGETVYIVVDGIGGSEGGYFLEVELP